MMAQHTRPSMRQLAGMSFDELRNYADNTRTTSLPLTNVPVRPTVLSSAFGPSPRQRMSIPSSSFRGRADDLAMSYEQLLSLDENNVRRSVPEQVRRRLPIVSASSRRPGQVGSVCLVCHEDVVAGARLCELPCQHRFHEACIMRWFDENKTCPVCRKEVC